VPEWQPLLDLLAEAADDESRVLNDFMWMHSVRLEDGRLLQAYKHYWTRRYVHLDSDGNAFVYTPYGYLQGSPQWELEMALHDTVGNRY
jgi:hypothetical protein